MKKFKITDMDGVSTCIYVIKGLEEKEGNEYPFLNKIDVKEEKKGEYTIKSFELDDNEKEIILLSILKDKVVINAGEVTNDSLNICTKPRGIRYKEIDFDDFDNMSQVEEKVFVYEPTEKRKIFVIDLDTGKEVDSEIISNGNKKVRICKINVGKKYFAFEYRIQDKRTIACGMCKFEMADGKFNIVVDEKETNRINYDLLKENINKGMAKSIGSIGKNQKERA